MDRNSSDDTPPPEPEPTDRISYLLPDGCKDITDVWRREEEARMRRELQERLEQLPPSPYHQPPADSVHHASAISFFDEASATPKSARPIRFPVNLIGTVNHVLLIQKQLAHDLDREPTPEEIAEKAHIPVERVRAVLRWVQRHPVVTLPATLSLRELAEVLRLKIYELVRELIGMKLFAKSDSMLDFATAAAVCSELGVIALPKDGE